MRKILHLPLLMIKQTRKFPFKTENQTTFIPVSLKAKTYLIVTDIKSKLSNKPDVNITKPDRNHISQLSISPITHEN